MIGEGLMPVANRRPATDDWPFVYLQEKSFSPIYVKGLLAIAAISIAAIFLIAPRATLQRFDWHMFFLGAAFALLEVKALTTFALLFGSTWIVNSLVFFAILLSVLLAVLLNARCKIKRVWIVYILLFAALVTNPRHSPGIINSRECAAALPHSERADFRARLSSECHFLRFVSRHGTGRCFLRFQSSRPHARRHARIFQHARWLPRAALAGDRVLRFGHAAALEFF